MEIIAWTKTSRTDAACTGDGSVESACSRCGETETDILLALGHDYTEISRIPATCDKDGSAISTCSRCGETKTDILSALEHDYKESNRYEDMDITLRRVAQNFYVVRRSLVPFCIVARRIYRRVGVDEQSKQIQDLYAMGMTVADTKQIFSPPLWKLFNSYNRKELPQKFWEKW